MTNARELKRKYKLEVNTVAPLSDSVGAASVVAASVVAASVVAASVVATGVVVGGGAVVGTGASVTGMKPCSLSQSTITGTLFEIQLRFPSAFLSTVSIKTSLAPSSGELTIARN